MADAKVAQPPAPIKEKTQEELDDEEWERTHPPIKLVFEKPPKPMVHCYDPEGFEACYAKLYTQDTFAEYIPYKPKQDPIDWDADVCLDDQFRVHLGAWPHATDDPKDSIIFESKDPEWIKYCTETLDFHVPEYIEEHKKIKIVEW